MRTLFLVVLLLEAVCGPAQQLRTAYESPSGLVKTPAGSAAVFNNYKDLGLNFQLNFGKAQVAATERPTLFDVNGLPVQVLAVPAAPHKKATAEATLAHYIASEAEYTSQAMAAPVRPAVAACQLRPGQTGQLWSYALPPGLSNEVERQVFLNFVHGDFIIGLGSAQFRGKSLKAVQAMLLTLARDMQFSPAAIMPTARK